MYGCPVDQDDGEILIDTTAGYPGSQFNDTMVTPGAYHYYGFYVLINAETDEWVRSGFAGCLMVNNYGSDTQMLNLIPNFYVNAASTGDELAQDPTGNTFLSKFMQVFGWGLDYLRTQYDTYRNVNDPWTIPLNDLHQMAAQFNVQVNPDIHPYTLRKAIFFNSTVNQQRGTPDGIATELSALTGWNANVTVGPNMMLDNDQSYFPDPASEPWSGSITYNIGETVASGDYYYQCISTANYGHAPTGTSSSNTWWSAILNTNDDTFLLNPATGNPSTWDVLYPTAINGVAASNSIFESLGVADPLNSANFQFNSLRAVNKSGGTDTVWLRSIARTPSDSSSTTFAPDTYQVIADGIPVPYSGFQSAWKNTVRYITGDIVTYSGIPYVALKSSTGITPPYVSAGADSNEWAPLGFDERYRICISAYVTASATVTVNPFVEWYDASGNYITRVISRNPVGGSVEIPNQLVMDSFTFGAGTSLNARTTDDSGSSWSVEQGAYSISPYTGGAAYPTTTGTRSYATVNPGVVNCKAGITFVTNPAPGQSEGLMLRFQDDNNYLRASMTDLRLKSSGSWSTLATYSTVAEPGDRLLVKLNGTSIICEVNGVQVASVTNSFNTSGTTHGIINENT